MPKTDLTVIEQRAVDFYGDTLDAIRGDDGQIYVGLRQMCGALDIDTTGQRQRIQRHTVLDKGLGVCKMQTPGGVQDTYVLRVDLVPLWLAGIRTNRLSAEIRPKLERFQTEAAAVLWEAFQSGRLTSEISIGELLQTDSPAAQAYLLGRAIMQMAQQQMQYEAATRARFEQHEQRLETIEATLGNPDRIVTDDEAMQISQGVKLVARELEARSGRNEYGGVYGELYRKFGITSYKLLPAAKFDQAMNFLRQWHESMTDDSAEF